MLTCLLPVGLIALRSGGRTTALLWVRAALMQSQNSARSSSLLWTMLLACLTNPLCCPKGRSSMLRQGNRRARKLRSPANTTKAETQIILWVTVLLQIQDNLSSQLPADSSPVTLGWRPTTLVWGQLLESVTCQGFVCNRDRAESLPALRAVISVLHLGTSQSSPSVSLTLSTLPVLHPSFSAC